MFVDELKIKISAGSGGDGVVRWRHEKSKEFSGPSGGNGGRGGDVYVEAVKDIGLLSKYKNKKEFRAENGEGGMRNSMSGGDGKDLVINFPVGSVIKNLETGKKLFLEKPGQRFLILKGGRGGLGNEHFKSSRNVRPTESTSGVSGEEADFLIELELIVDAGIVGLPNAGKSSLLNSLTKSRAKVGDFPFTTIEPNLGDFRGLILADIPGLIEGASEGKGLGDKFLRHIKRTKALIHCISAENENIEESYKVVRRELENYNKELISKKEIVVITKSDLLEEAKKEEITGKVSKILGKEVLSVSVLDDSSVKELGFKITSILEK